MTQRYQGLFVKQGFSKGKQGIGFSVSLLLAGIMTSGTAFAQSTISDAQVESNVLKALAATPELANETITTSTVYGTVTLSGSVTSEEERRKAETLASNADGVKKVVDELQLSGSAVPVQVASSLEEARYVQQPAQPLLLQSDGTYAPAPASSPTTPNVDPASASRRDDPERNQQVDQQPAETNADGSQGNARADYPQTGQAPYPQNGGATNSQQSGNYGRHPIYPPYPHNGYPPPAYPSAGSQTPYQAGYGGQTAGESVTIPSGTMIRVRLNRTLSSERSQPGTVFDGVIANDVVAGGAVAIPRGAMVEGKVVDARSSGVLKGRGEMSIELTWVTLGGRTFPLSTDLWAQHGGDKTIESVNKTAGFGAVGAVIGALAGGGIGAAVGGGIGAAAGLGSSAASGNGQVYVPAEGMLTFHLAQEASVTTVSQAEMMRLASGMPVGADSRNVRQRNYPRVYVGPGYPGYYYPGPYPPYGHPY